VALQLVIASSMILLHLPPVLRSLHEATGVGIWLSCFLLAYLARRVSPTHSPLGDEGVSSRSSVPTATARRPFVAAAPRDDARPA
jgi:hypothetical protein